MSSVVKYEFFDCVCVCVWMVEVTHLFLSTLPLSLSVVFYITVRTGEERDEWKGKMSVYVVHFKIFFYPNQV